MNAVKEYVAACQQQTQANNLLITEFEEEVSKMHGKCIDLGCGPGTFTRHHLLPKLPADANVVGCDISRKMIDYAKTVNADEKRISFIELDIETEQLPSNQVGVYDNAVSFFCIQMCRDLRKVFENVYHLLRPGGKCLVLFVSTHPYFNAVKKLQGNPKYAPFMKDASIPITQNCETSRIKLKEILKAQGFDVIHCSLREKTYKFKNPEAIKRFIQSVNPFSERMSPDIRDKFEDDFLHELIETRCYFDESGPQILLHYEILVAYIKKI